MGPSLTLPATFPFSGEVGATAALYAPTGDVAAWTSTARAILDGLIPAPSIADRIARAGTFTWERHALTILDAYLEIAARERRAR